MAGLTLANAYQNVPDGALYPIGGLVPALKFDSVCLSACLNGSSLVDTYIDVLVVDAALALLGYVVFNEPVRYRVAGGSPVLLQNFIYGAGTQLAIRGYVPSQMNVTLFNRWRFDA